jgi:RNA recognition motif. (a.k.a. RRM, RBD, or RNP domain)
VVESLGIGSPPQDGRLTPFVVEQALFPSRWCRARLPRLDNDPPEPIAVPASYKPVSYFNWVLFPIANQTPGAGHGAAQTEEGVMMVNIYVGNLSWSCTNDDLMQLFSPHGTVARAQIIMDRETGRSRGFGFVEMASEAEAKSAIAELNEFEFQGRPLTVNEAKPREPRPGGGGGYGGGRGGGGGAGYGGGRGGGGYSSRGGRY